eukprot:6177468-Pleurochrysis_carterae.AAC.1
MDHCFTLGSQLRIMQSAVREAPIWETISPELARDRSKVLRVRRYTRTRVQRTRARMCRLIMH